MSGRTAEERLLSLQSFIPGLLDALPWGAYKGALLEDSDIKDALRAVAKNSKESANRDVD